MLSRSLSAKALGLHYVDYRYLTWHVLVTTLLIPIEISPTQKFHAVLKCSSWPLPWSSHLQMQRSRAKDNNVILSPLHLCWDNENTSCYTLLLPRPVPCLNWKWVGATDLLLPWKHLVVIQKQQTSNLVENLKKRFANREKCAQDNRQPYLHLLPPVLR